MANIQSARQTTPRRATSTDVARLAGVSRATVSFVINGVESANISAETQARVWEAIAKLDYQPHEAARHLRGQSSRVLSVAIPDANNPHYLQIVAGIEAYAREKGYSVFLSITDFQHENEKRCFAWLKQKRSDALILISETERTLLEELQAINHYHYVVTSVGSIALNKLDTGLDSVVPTPRIGEQLVLEHLASLGHRRIGYIYGVANAMTLGERLKACLESQQTLGIPVNEQWIRTCSPTQEGGYQATRALVENVPLAELPTALVVVNDLLASAVLAALWELHIAVPEEISVISFDNIPSAQYTIPSLTTIDADGYQLGIEAARLTIERLTNVERPAVHLELPSHLVVRQSTAQARASE